MKSAGEIEWLLGEDNPAVKYRAQTEILGQSADKTSVLEWLNAFLPADWTARTGLWFRYYITAFAECGLSYTNIPLDKEAVIGFWSAFPFEHSCADYMHLRALVKLGLADEPTVAETIRHMPEHQLPDGGFLCLHRVDKLKRIPKSCVKASMYALLFTAECKKLGISTEIEQPLVDYFWNHKLFYRTDAPDVPILNVREGWRTIDTFYPFEVMRVGLQNILEAFCVLGYGKDKRLSEAWELLRGQTNAENKAILNGTLTKSYLPKERVGKPSKWVTFYTLMAKNIAQAD